MSTELNVQHREKFWTKKRVYATTKKQTPILDNSDQLGFFSLALIIFLWVFFRLLSMWCNKNILLVTVLYKVSYTWRLLSHMQKITTQVLWEHNTYEHNHAAVHFMYLWLLIGYLDKSLVLNTICTRDIEQNKMLLRIFSIKNYSYIHRKIYLKYLNKYKLVLI